MTTTFPHIRVEGSASERGRQYGALARERIARSLTAYREVFEHYAGWDWATVRREAARFKAPIAEFGPTWMDEICGIADGAGVDVEDVLAINVRTEVMFGAKARSVTPGRESTRGPAVAECSAFAVVPAPGQAGPTLAGQNWDWLPHSADTVVVLEVKQDEGPDYVTVVEAGLLAKTGLNSSGVGLVTNAMVTADDVGAPGVPYHVVLRAILDCETVTDALAVLQTGTRSSAANYLLTHVGGVAINIEAAPGDHSGLYFLYPEDGVLLHTNHFLSPAFIGQDTSLLVMPDSVVRLQRLRAGVAAHRAGSDGRPTLDVFASLLGDHADYPSGVCCHPDPRAHPLEQGATVASVLMDLDSKQMWLADGYPCHTAYRQLDYSGFLAPRTSDNAMGPEHRRDRLTRG